MKISMNTVTFNRCKVKRANKRVSESHQAFGSSEVFIFAPLQHVDKEHRTPKWERFRKTRRSSFSELKSGWINQLQERQDEHPWVSCRPQIQASHSREPHACSCQGVRPCTNLQLTQANCNMSLSLQKTSNRTKLRGKQRAHSGPHHSALFPSSTGSQTAAPRS